MDSKIKKVALCTFIIYAIVNILAYSLAHVAYLLANDTAAIIFEYIDYYVSRILDFLAPVIIATITLWFCASVGIKKAITLSFIISAARVFYTLPHYYMIFISNYGYDSLESILISTLASALTVALTVGGALLSIAIVLFVLGRIEKKSTKEVISDLPLLINKQSTLSYLERHNLPILIFVLIRFVFALLAETVDAIAFFVKYSPDYTALEIVTILTNYVIIFVLLVTAYIISSYIKNKIVKFVTDENGN